LEELKEQSRRQAQAAEVVPCVTVTEKNWAALLGLQQSQIQLLVEVQTAAARLATKEELVEYLDQRVQELESCTQEMQSSAQKFQREIERSASEIAKNLTSQAGKMSEEFSRNLSLQGEQMKKFSAVLFWIALIPSAALVILELISHIFPLIFPG
jgi:chromosome segregation ATPase